MKSALVVDDHPMIHFGCVQMLQQEGFTEVLDARDGETANVLVQQHQPDLVVLDLTLPDGTGLDLIQPFRAAAPNARILVFTMNDRPVFAKRALEAGAHGFLSKNASPADFRDAIDTLSHGQTYLEHTLAMEVIALQSDRTQLTRREEQMLKLLAEGCDLRAAGLRLGISYKTAANLSSGLKRKLNLGSMAELVQYALRESAVQI